jgi:hypothetical protein
LSKQRPEVKLVKLNWDKECERDFIVGRGFEVTEPAFKSKEEKSMYGIHSPLFATDYEDEDAFAERYSCKCGEFKGRVYENEICPYCGTKVKFKDVDLKIFGWIMLKSHKIIHPIFYKMLESIIGSKIFPEIIQYDKSITRDGIVVDKKGKNPFKGIGLIEFYERFDEIMDYYTIKKKNKKELIQEVMHEREKVFASCIPVYSSVLRPAMFKGETYFYNPFDKKYNVIFSLSRLLNDPILLYPCKMQQLASKVSMYPFNKHTAVHQCTSGVNFVCLFVTVVGIFLKPF